MFSIIKQAYACSLEKGIKLPSYCGGIGPDCSCLNINTGKTVPVEVWRKDIPTPSVFERLIWNQFFFIFFIPILILSFISLWIIYTIFLKKRLKGRSLFLRITIKVILFLTIFSILAILVNAFISPLLGVRLF